jgi:Concanavalin A-like lectin/glucanases superfamily/Secretion system C-terminal sorting domain
MKQYFSLLFISSAISLQAQVTANLVAHYNFDGNTNDQKGVSNAKAYNCSFVNDRQGNPASAVYIKGATNSFINLGTSSVLKPTAGAVSLWANVDAICDVGSGFDYNPMILAKNNASKSSYFEGYCLYIKRADKKFLAITTRESNNAERYIFGSNAATLDNWHHLVINYNYDSLWLYVDNVLQNRIVRGFDQVFANGDSVLMGATKVGNNDRYFNGALDEVRIYNKILSAKQVDSLFKMAPVSGLKEMPLNELNTYLVYPNPGNGVVFFNPVLNISDYQVIDLAGKVISSGKAEKSLDLSDRKGVYVIRCNDGSGNSRTEKLILE